MATPITYVLEIPAGSGFERKCTGGRPTTVKVREADGSLHDVAVVQFAEKYQHQPIVVRYDQRPDLAALVDAYRAEQALERAEREAAWKSAQAREIARDQPLLDAMRAEESALAAKIPADGVRVTVTQTGSLDGDPILDWAAEGIKLTGGRRDKVVVVGWASAVRPGALAAFEQVCVAYILRSDLDALKGEVETKAAADSAARQEREAKEAADIAAALATAQQTGQPVAYKRSDWHLDDGHEWAYETIHYVRPDGTTYTKQERSYCG